MKVETTDLYLSAYLMSKGIPLDSMNIRNGGNRQKIIFVFSGNGNLDQLNQEFQRGYALVNPIDLKKSILHLKDMMYDRLRTCNKTLEPHRVQDKTREPHRVQGRKERREHYVYNQRKDRSRQAV